MPRDFGPPVHAGGFFFVSSRSGNNQQARDLFAGPLPPDRSVAWHGLPRLNGTQAGAVLWAGPPQFYSSSRSRRTASLSGFFDLSHVFDRPLRWGASRRFDTIPSTRGRRVRTP